MVKFLAYFSATLGEYMKKSKTTKTIQESNQNLTNGAVYFTENMATNHAQLSAIYKTNSFKVDKTPPVVGFFFHSLCLDFGRVDLKAVWLKVCCDSARN
jgi:wobble nucleotide-excising tRNase